MPSKDEERVTLLRRELESKLKKAKDEEREMFLRKELESKLEKAEAEGLWFCSQKIDKFTNWATPEEMRKKLKKESIESISRGEWFLADPLKHFQKLKNDAFSAKRSVEYWEKMLKEAGLDLTGY